MLDVFNQKHGEQDVIVVTGDFIAHHIAMAYPDSSKYTYGLLLDTHERLTSILAEKFPNTLILPAFGNNDSEFHDNPQPDSQAT